MRTNVYVDGFNLYYAIRATPYKWLDLGKLCKSLLSAHQINRIRYFAALIQPRDDPEQPQRQQVYIRALRTIPNLSIHYGTFLSSRRFMPLATPPTGGSKFVEVIRTEEKGSDVNLASYLLVDGFEKDYELAVIISNDSDLVLPIQLLRAKLALSVGVLCPPRRRMSSQVATFQRMIRERALRVSQLPTTLQDETGTIVKPSGW